MKQITQEQIDNVVEENYSKITNNVIEQLADNIELMEQITKNDSDVLKQTGLYIAIIKTAQENCIFTIKESLKQLFCE